MASSAIEVRVGQVWEECDRRAHGRRVRVYSIGETHATCRVVGTSRDTKIRIDRFRPRSTGYRLVEDAPAGTRTP